jgi:transcriptional regulator with GAF, ATPase, and Fis domain
MAKQTSNLDPEVLERLSRLSSNTQQLETVLSRLFQQLASHGVQISLDISGMMQNIRRDVDGIEKSSRRLSTERGQLEDLVHTSARITSSLELDRVLEDVMDTVIGLTGAERAYLLLKDKRNGELKFRAARNWDQENLAANEVVFSSSVVSTALEQGEAIITTNAQADERFSQNASVATHGLRSIMCIPLMVRGEGVGVLYTDNRIEQGIFDPRDIPLLTAFGTQAAIAIENAQNFTKVKDDLNRARREVERLQIQIDQSKVHEQVSEITDSDFFQSLSAQAKAMRKQFGEGAKP